MSKCISKLKLKSENYLNNISITKSLILFLLYTFISFDIYSQLQVYPGLPGDHLKSGVYKVNVALEDEEFTSTYVYQYLVNIGSSTNKNFYDPYNISSAYKRDVLTDNHWTSVSYNNNSKKMIFEIVKIGSDITSCEVKPFRYGYNAEIKNGKAYISVDGNNKFIFLKINNDDFKPLFLFVNPLEENVPTTSTSTLEYFGPGIHTIGEQWTPPSGKTEVYIAGGAYLKGSIYMKNRSNITIRGRGILSGEGFNYRSGSSGIPWCAVFFDGGGNNQVVEGITSIKPLHFHILSRGTLKTQNVKCLSFNNTTDGWGGEDNSSIENSFFKVNDDVIKLYGDNQTVRNIVVYHQTNTPVFEYGWGGQEAKNCTIEHIDIVEDRHVAAAADNGGIIGWASANSNKKHLGHVFRDVRSDCTVNFLMDVNLSSEGGGSSAVFTLEDWKIKNTRIKSKLTESNGGQTKVTFNNIIIDNQCVTNSEFTSNAGAELLFICNLNTPVEKIRLENTEIFSTQILNGKLMFYKPLQDKAIINLIDLSGRSVSSQTLSPGQISADFQEIHKGIFILELINGSKISRTKVIAY